MVDAGAIVSGLGQLLGQFIGAFVPIFVAMDPIGTVPLVLGWTHHLAPEERARQLRAGLITALILGFIFLVGGTGLLTLLGVSVGDFLIAGGIVLLVLAVSDLVVGGGHEGRGMESRSDLGVVPIGTPLLAGPAALTTIVVLVERYGFWLTAAALLANLAIAWRLFVGADTLMRVVGGNGLRAASKVVSLLLAAIAVKFIREGFLMFSQ